MNQSPSPHHAVPSAAGPPRSAESTETAGIPGPRLARDRGELFTLRAGDYVAEVSTVGAVVESLTVGGRDLLVRNPEDGPMVFHRGALVAPWPNRIGDGLYTWDGQEIQAPITEVERENALHGLVSFQPFARRPSPTTRSSCAPSCSPPPAIPSISC